MLKLIAEPIVRAALLEDAGRGGDITTEAIVDAERAATARIVARDGGIVAGTAIAGLAFTMLDPDATYDARINDGRRVESGQTVAVIRGRARAIFTAERTALNLLCRLSGIATATRALVDLVAGTRARIADTRKTTPGLRALERYAVRCGGGVNHRFGLDDAVLIKDNHLALAGSIGAAVAAVRARAGHMVKVEVEVDTLEQLREALAEPIDAVLLDNMTPETLAQAVVLAGGRVLTEASGGVSVGNVAAIARTGVDVISVGRLTHSAPALDLGLDVEL
ncbi:MAG: carboxylating nicotinate-nucleotide diphosphorylase [Candidatus Baltobacteraceae bacterium]